MAVKNYMRAKWKWNKAFLGKLVKILHMKFNLLLKFSETESWMQTKPQHPMTVTFPGRVSLCISAGLIIFNLTATI